MATVKNLVVTLKDDVARTLNNVDIGTCFRQVERWGANVDAAINGSINGISNRLLPAGGSTGQVLTKTSAADYAANWQTPASQPGLVGTGTGPAAQTNFTTISPVVQFSVPVTAGHTYLAVAQCSGTQITAAGPSLMRVRDPASIDWVSWPGQLSLAINQVVNTTITGWWSCTTTGTGAFAIFANAPTGAFQINANNGKLAVFDMGHS